jgi:hypothetical protein
MWCEAHLWIVPAQAAAAGASAAELVPTQTFQKLTGTPDDGGTAAPVTRTLRGGDRARAARRRGADASARTGCARVTDVG